MAIEYKEVKHGEWIVLGDGNYVPHMCSVCGKTSKLWYADEPYKYCPNCGAEMILKEKP